jgi:hypothetical protein
MTLENTLRKKLTEPPPENGGPVVISHQGWNVSLRPESSDAIGTSLRELSVEREGAAPAGDVRAWGERISRKVTGLLEPLAVHEVDTPRQVAILRSATPTPQDPGLHYTEVELHGTAKATVRRFRGFQDVGHPREPIPFTLTHEGLGKMIGDLTADK